MPRSLLAEAKGHWRSIENVSPVNPELKHEKQVGVQLDKEKQILSSQMFYLPLINQLYPNTVSR